MRYTGFIGPSYTLDSVNIEAQRCINLYPKLNEMKTGKEVGALIPTPGLSLLTALSGGVFRGQYTASNGVLYAVGGNKFYRINSSWVATELGELLTSSGPVDFKDNGTTLVFVDGPNGYTHVLGSTEVNRIVSDGWRGSNTVDYIDHYFLFTEPETGIFYITGLASTTLDPLDFATAEGSPDNIVTAQVNHQEVWLFGSQSIETWYNSGNADFPFERSGIIEVGCAAAFSVAKIGRTTFWLGCDQGGQGIVYAAQGLTPQRISTHAVELEIQSYGDMSDAVAWTYQENGHFFYVLNFTSANTTWVYDLTSGLWHERAYLCKGKLQRHRANGHSFAYNTHVVGDYENGNIYKLDSNCTTDNGSEIKRVRAATHINNSNKKIRHNSFELEAETGHAVDGYSLDKEANIILQYSDDGGHTWSNEKWLGLGRVGEKKKRIKWTRLGMSVDRVYRVTMTDPVKVVFMGVEINAEGMLH